MATETQQLRKGKNSHLNNIPETLTHARINNNKTPDNLHKNLFSLIMEHDVK